MDRRARRTSPKRPHRYQWLIDSLSDQPHFIQRQMFGETACYLKGRLVLVLCARDEEPWRGVLLPTEREFHASLMKEYPELSPHPVLGKWLYLQEREERFEETANAFIERILAGDQRFGIEPK